MIEKIIAIKNVGRLRSCPAAKAVGLAKCTLIYGENARGKTTLSAILRSLAEGDPSYVLERQTLGQSSQCAVDLLVDGQKLSFRDGKWEADCPRLLVFDPTYIRRNVHAGYEITPDHRQNLAQVVLGQRAVQLVGKLRELADARRKATDEAGRIEQQIADSMASPMPVEAFVSLAPQDGVDEKIAAAQRALDSVKRAETIRKAESVMPLSIPSPPFEAVREALARRLPDVAEDAERKVRDHVACHLDENGEAWLGQGAGYAQDTECCPFCGEPLSRSELIAAYRSYFSEAYEAHKKSIRVLRADVEAALGQAALSSCRTVPQSNRLHLQFWAEHLPPSPPPVDARGEEEASQAHGLYSVEECDIAGLLDGVRDMLTSLLDRKLASPLDRVEPGPEFEAALRSWEQASVALDRYNAGIAALAERIEARRRQIGETDVASVEAQLNLLLNAKRRHGPNTAALCNRYPLAREQRSELDRMTKALQAQLREHAETAARRYGEAIREHLARFNCTFELVMDKPDLRAGGKPRMAYLIRINDESIDPVPPSPSSAVPCFRNTLGDGDITTLAFAFFLAQLDEMANMKDHIVVFDDPLPSQDNHRRQQTVQDLVRLARRAGQLIVLSHDRMFLRQMRDALAAQQQQHASLHLARSGTDSDLLPWDLVGATDLKWFADFKLVERYARGEFVDVDLASLAGTIRRVVEFYLRVQARNELAPDSTLGQMIGLIRNASSRSRLEAFKPLLQELEDIDAFVTEPTHAEGYDPKASIDDGQLCGIARRAVALVDQWPPAQQ